MEVFFVKYSGNQPVAIWTHQLISATGQWIQTLFNVADVIGASTSDATRRLLGLPEDYGPLTLHAVADGVEASALEPDLLLSDLTTGRSAKMALIIKTHKEFTAAGIQCSDLYYFEVAAFKSHLTAPPRWMPSEPFSISSNTGNFEDAFVIAVYSSFDPPVLIISVPSPPSGRPLHRILLFLRVVCGNFDVSDYTLNQKVAEQLTAISLDSVSSILLPGNYYFTPNRGGPDLKAEGWGLPIVPISRLKRKSNPGSPSSSSAIKKYRVEVLVAEDNESVTTDDLELTKRSGQFRERVIARDNHCAVTRSYGALEAAHILAHSWWRESPMRKELLPIDIKQIVSTLDGGIDNVRNGILLRGDLATAFGEGKFSFFFSEGHFYFVSITTEFMDFDGIQLDENLRQRSDGSCWWSVQNRPHSRLVEFHLKNSVFKHMRASGWTEDEWDSESEEPADEMLIGKLKCSSGFPQLGIDWRTDLPYSEAQ